MRRLAGRLALPAAAVLLLAAGYDASSGPTDCAPPAGCPAVNTVPSALLPAFRAAGRAFAVPVGLLLAVAQVESGFNPRAVGPVVPGGPALGMMQFLPSSWQLFNVVPGATPFDPGPAVFAAANHLRHSGRLPDGGWDAAQALFGYNHDWGYVRQVLAVAVGFGYRYAGPSFPGPIAAAGRPR